MTIGERIKQRRQELGLSADQVAEAIGKNRATIYRYESDEIEKFPIGILYPLAEVLQTTPQYLMGWEDQSPQDISTIVDIKGRRIDRGLSIQEAADAVGVSPETLTDWEEHGIKGISSLQLSKLADMVGLSTSYFQNPNDLNVADPNGVLSRSEVIRIPLLEGITARSPLYSYLHISGYTYTDLQSGAEFFAMIAPDNSMSAARIQEGDMLIIRRQSSVEVGKIAVVLVENRPAIIRRYYRTGNTVTLIPQALGDNFQPESIDLTTTPFRVIGQVVRDTFDFDM